MTRETRVGFIMTAAGIVVPILLSFGSFSWWLSGQITELHTNQNNIAKTVEKMETSLEKYQRDSAQEFLAMHRSDLQMDYRLKLLEDKVNRSENLKTFANTSFTPAVSRSTKLLPAVKPLSDSYLSEDSDKYWRD